jgi:hypothetical protein
LEARADFALLPLPVLPLRDGRQTANVQNVAQAIKTSIFFCAWAENKNIEARACVSAELMSVGGVMNCFC